MQDLEILNNSFLIIGGPNTKKSEVSRELSKRLQYKLINLDREKHTYFDDFTDYDFKIYQNRIEKYGEIKAVNYIHKYEMKHLKHVLENINENVVIDFGNTYTLIDDINILNKIKLFKNIVLLEIDNQNENNEYNKKLYKNRINKEIASIIIDVTNKSKEKIVEEILNYKEFKDIL